MKSIRKISIVIGLILISSSLFSSNDSIVGNNNLFLPGTSFFNAVYNNPAATFWKPSPNQGIVELGYLYNNKNSYHFLQEGSGGNSYNLLAEGFTIKENNAFWGKASFNKYKKNDVRWSDSSDPLLMGPYLIADSIGGDTYGEEYQLSGGFANRKEKITWGLEAGYRAGSEYRKTDPRPKTIISDLSAKIGIGYSLKNYQAGVSISGGIYKQDVDIRAFEDDSKYDFFVMKGFGLYDRNFSDKENTFTWKYEGNSYGGAIFILPHNNNGVIGNIDYSKRIIDSRVDVGIRIPFSFSTSTIHALVGYKKQDIQGSTLVKVEMNYQSGKGTERIYDTISVNEDFFDYTLLSASHKYTRNITGLKATGLKEWFSDKRNQWIEGSAGWSVYEELYSYPSYHINYQHLISYISGGMEFFLKKESSFTTEATIQYQPLLSSETAVPEQDRIFMLSMQPNLKILEMSPFGFNLKLLYQTPVKKNIQLYIKAEGNMLIAEGENNKCYGVNMALGFKY